MFATFSALQASSAVAQNGPSVQDSFGLLAMQDDYEANMAAVRVALETTRAITVREPARETAREMARRTVRNPDRFVIDMYN